MNVTAIKKLFSTSKSSLLGTKRWKERWYWIWKEINKFVDYKHFKMESINVINLIKSNVYTTSTDLKKKAFFSVPIHNDHQMYLKFLFGNLFQSTPCLMLNEYLLKYQKYLLDVWEAKVTAQLYM